MATQTAHPVATGTPPAPADFTPPGPRLFWTWAPSLLPTLLMLVVGRFQLRQPGLGWDENATWIVSQRTPAQIADLAGYIDGVIAPYYFLLHYWTQVFGDSELSMRVPSLLAVAAGVGVAGEVGRRLFTPGVGLLGGLMLVAVPQMSRYAQDARAYGLAFLFATLATLLLYLALARPSWWRWIAYAVVVTLIGWAHIIALLVLAGHAYVAISRGGWRRWLPATVVGVLPVLPLVWLGLGQRGRQVDWIEDMSFDQVFKAPGMIFGAGMTGLLLIGLAFAVRWTERRPVHELAVLAALPPILLMGVSFLGSSLWVPRYVLFVVPMVALLAAAALHGMRVRAVLAMVVLIGVSIPANQEFRAPAAHIGPDFRAVTDVIAAGQQPGDAIVYGDSGTWSLRAGVDYRMRGAKPQDVLLEIPAAEVGELEGKQCDDQPKCLGDAPRVWFFRQWQDGEPVRDAGPMADTLKTKYKVVQVWQPTRATLVLLERAPAKAS